MAGAIPGMAVSLPKPGQVAKPPAPPKPPSIMAKAIAGHPTWFPNLPKTASVPKPPSGAAKSLAPQPPQAAPAGPQAPASAPRDPSPAPATGAPAPAAPSTAGNELDSTYYANVAANQVKTNASINALNLGMANGQTALQSALAQLAYQQPRSQLALEQKANASGGLYSSVYDQNLGDLNYQFAGKQGAAQQKYSDLYNADAAKIAGLQQGEGLYQQGQALASSQRASANAAKNPAISAPPAPPAPKPPPAPKASKPSKPNTKAPASKNKGKR